MGRDDHVAIVTIVTANILPKRQSERYLRTQTAQKPHYQVAHQLLVNGRGEMPTKLKCPKLSLISEDYSLLVFPFTEEEYKSIATLKNKKAADIDDVLVEQLKNLGSRAHRWLHSMLNVCFTDNRIPKVWRQSKIIETGKTQRYRRDTDLYPSYVTCINCTNVSS